MIKLKSSSIALVLVLSRSSGRSRDQYEFYLDNKNGHLKIMAATPKHHLQSYLLGSCTNVHRFLVS